MKQNRLKHLSPEGMAFKRLIQKRATRHIWEFRKEVGAQFSLNPCSVPQLHSQIFQLLWNQWGHHLSDMSLFGRCFVQRAFSAWWRARLLPQSMLSLLRATGFVDRFANQGYTQVLRPGLGEQFSHFLLEAPQGLFPEWAAGNLELDSPRVMVQVPCCFYDGVTKVPQLCGSPKRRISVLATNTY